MFIEKRIKGCLKEVDRSVVFISFISMLIAIFYINPFNGTNLAEWNRTFCSTLFWGISINKRILNFYKLLLFLLPLFFFVFLIFNTILFKHKESYKELFVKFDIFFACFISISYISRYAGKNIIDENPMMECIIGFYGILIFLLFIDKKQSKSFSYVTNVFIRFFTIILTINILFHLRKPFSLIIAMFVCCLYEILCQRFVRNEKILKIMDVWCSFLIWIPAFIRIVLEFIYVRVEQGSDIQRYFTHITRATIILLFIFIPIALIIEKKQIKVDTFEHIGFIISAGGISFFNASYQYVFSYTDTLKMYELGNFTAATDTILHGKLPIIDYFSAHALDDVFTKIIYYLIHKDVNGIFVDPYKGLIRILAMICVYLIIRAIFDRNVAILFVCLFPTSTTNIVVISLCCFSIALLLHIVNKPGWKTFLLYWIVVLISAFYVYDQGVALGIGSIFAYCIICLMEKEWKRLIQYIATGGMVGILAGILCTVYAISTGVPIIKRLKEWMSVGLSSSSSWATMDIGDTASFAFLISYFVAPAIAVCILGLTIFKFIKYKKYPHIASLAIAFSISELIYITRTMVFHNLAVSGGATSVLLNFIHWSIASYILYSVSMDENKSDNFKLASWITAFFMVIIMEGCIVTGSFPGQSSALMGDVMKKSVSWELTDDNQNNVGQKRIIFDESLNTYIDRFKIIFDSLLKEDETFIDFANITSIYAFTDRQRPSYVAQTPSLLTDLYSQDCYLEEIEQYECPLTIIGTTESQYLQQMSSIPHNIRYYKIAEYIYNRYRPLVNFDEYSIWCKKDQYMKYKKILSKKLAKTEGFVFTDYGYDETKEYIDEMGSKQIAFSPYHNYELKMVPYIWANYDDYNANQNKVIKDLKSSKNNTFAFDGSQSVLTDKGNYLIFECTNDSAANVSATIIFRDSKNKGARFQYSFFVVPGTQKYMIRVSQDYFWDVYNIDRISIVSGSDITISNMKVLEGD